MKNIKVLFAFLVLIALTMACASQVQPTPQVVIVTVEVPVQAPPVVVQAPPQPVVTEVPPVVQAPPPVVTEAPPVVVAPPPVVESPPQSSEVIFTANTDLSCAEGPDWARYWFVDALREYESATVKAVNGDYGLITIKGKDCWVWLEKGEVEGDLGQLPNVDAPKLPIVQFTLENGLGTYVYLVIYNYDTGERVKTLALNKGDSHELKLPSGYYSIQGFDKNDKQIYGVDYVNLAAGDGDHYKGLKDGTAWLTLCW